MLWQNLWQNLWQDIHIHHDNLEMIIAKVSFLIIVVGGILAVIMNGVRHFEPDILRMYTNRLNNGINYLPIGAVAGGVVLGCFWWAHSIVEGDSSLFVMSGFPSLSFFFGIFCGTFPGAAIGFVYGMFMLPGKGTSPDLIQDISILYKSLWFSLLALALYLNRRILFSSDGTTLYLTFGWLFGNGTLRIALWIARTVWQMLSIK